MLSPTSKKGKILWWTVVWTIIMIATMTIAYPAGQEVYFGWLPAPITQVMIVAAIAYLFYIPYMYDFMYNVNPVDEENLRPVEGETAATFQEGDSAEEELAEPGAGG